MKFFEAIVTLVVLPVVLPVMLISWLVKFLYRHRTAAFLIACLAVAFSVNPESKTEEVSHVGAEPASLAELYVAPQIDWLDEEYILETVDPVKDSLPWSYRNGGVCRTLTEDASAMVIFLEDSQSKWTQWEMQNYLDNMISPGFGFIEHHAASYGYDITLEWIYYVDENNNPQSTAYNGTVRDFNNGYTPDIADAVAVTRGYGSTAAMLESFRNQYGNDQVAFIFVLDKPGRSYAHWNSNSGDYLEYAVLFTSQNGYQLRPDVVAHEMMHLFGAEDMYAEGNVRVNRAAMAQRICPNELYLNPQWNLYDNKVSDFTAYAVGWLNDFPDQYRAAEWWS